MSNGFKLIAIRPLEGCNAAKVLKENETYYFCSDYEIDLERDEITYTQSIPDDLYNITRAGDDLEVNIHAIVGENGTGKSSIVELLAMAINDLSKWHKKFDHDLDYSSQYESSAFTNVQFYYQIKSDKGEIEIQKIDIHNGAVSFSIYGLDGDRFRLKELNANFDFNDFFYTFLANYSLYSLNESHIGYWIFKIFHKREAYQVPLNIYPLRKQGNIDINNEMHLTKSRLLSNVLIKKDDDSLNNKISDNQHIIAVPIKPFESDPEKKRIVTSFWDGNEISEFYFDDLEIPDNLLERLFRIYGKKFDQKLYRDTKEKSYGVDVYSDTCNYIIRKLFKIPVNYESLYIEYISQVKDNGRKKLRFKGNILDEYLTRLKDQNTVITLKLRQAINFIDSWETWQQYYQEEKILFPIEKLSKIIYELASDTKSFIEHLPPPVYEIDFWLSLLIEYPQHFIPIEGENYSLFNYLSSGEKQIIFSVQSVLYHLLNLNSIHNSEDELCAYRFVNLIFDEIELYFHPEFQRRYITELLDGIKRIYIPKIEAINMCFVTHSPFILSDIPESHCMFLKVEEDSNGVKKAIQKADEDLQGLKTFGANIHDMLCHGFFMKNGSIGEFARYKIDKIVNLLYEAISGNKEKQEKVKREKNEIENQIELIGDEMVRGKLLKMLYQITAITPKEALKEYYLKKLKELDD